MRPESYHDRVCRGAKCCVTELAIIYVIASVQSTLHNILGVHSIDCCTFLEFLDCTCNLYMYMYMYGELPQKDERYIHTHTHTHMHMHTHTHAHTHTHTHTR